MIYFPAQSEADSLLSWAHFATKESDLDSALLVPTVVFGRGAFLVRKSAVTNDSVVIFSQQQTQETKGKRGYFKGDSTSNN